MGSPPEEQRLEKLGGLGDWDVNGRWSLSLVFTGAAGIGQFNDSDIGQKAMFYRAVVEQ